MNPLFKIRFLLIFALIVGLQPTSALAAYTGYSWRASLTIPAALFTAELADFPVLFNQQNLPAAIFDEANADGGDIRFSSDSTGDLPLNREIESFDNVGNTAEIWVKVPTLSNLTDTVIYVWYGNASASEPAANDADEGSEGVWDANFKGVYHLSEAVNNDPGGYKDATANANHMTGTSMALSAVAGAWAGSVAAEFDGSADYLSRANVADTPKTYSAWMYPDTETTDYAVISSADTTVTNKYFGLLALGNVANDPVTARHVNGSTANAYKPDFTATTWNHIAAKFVSTTSRYPLLNGAAGTNDTTSINDFTASNLVIAGLVRSSGLAIPFNGIIDEVRISNSARDDAWLAAEYTVINSITNITPGTPESPGGSVARVIRLTGGLRLLGGTCLC